MTQTVVHLSTVSDATLASISPDANLGHEHTLDVRYLSSRQMRQSLMRFNLAAEVPAEAVIDEAQLELYLEGASGVDPVFLTLSRVTEDWSESSVTWNDRPAFDAPHLARAVGSAIGYTVLDVTDIVRAWHGVPHYGLQIHALDDGSVYDRVFESREHGEMPPRLAVTYHIPSPVEYHFFGHVYRGSPPDRGTPVLEVNVGLWGDDDEWPENGRTQLAATATNEDGHFELHWQQDETEYAYLHVVEEDPPGVASTGARSDDQQVGYVKNLNVISYLAPPSGEYTGLAFWDDLPETAEPTPEATPTATRPDETPEPTPTASATLSPDCFDVVENGGFETGSITPWMSFGATGLGPGRHTDHGAWLGGSDNAGGELLQQVHLPAGASPVRLAYWWMADGEVDQPEDRLEVIVQYGEDQADHLRTHRAVTPRGVWVQDAIDLSDYTGQNVAVTFLVSTDDEIPSVFRVDDVSVHVCGGATPTPSPTATAEPSATIAPDTSATPTVMLTTTPTEIPPSVTPTPSVTATSEAPPTPSATPDDVQEWVVNTTSDHDDSRCEPLETGNCTLREALNRANDRGGPDTIRFDIPTDDDGHDPNTNVWTIEAITALPDVVDPYTIVDGGSEPDGSVIDGDTGQRSRVLADPPSRPASCPCKPNTIKIALSNPYKINTGNAALKNVTIVRKGSAGVLLTGKFALGTTVRCVSVLSGASVTASAGITIDDGAHDNFIDCNACSGHSDGIALDGGAYENALTRNYLGPFGGQIGNGWGVYVRGGAHDNYIGHPTTTSQGNVLSGNLNHGLLLGSQADDNLVRGNWIGVLPGSIAAKGNSGNGVHIWKGAKGNTIGPDNTIANNDSGGVVFSPYQPGGRNTITKNSIYDNMKKGIHNPRTKPPVIQHVGLNSVSGTTIPLCAHCGVEVFLNPSYKPSPIYDVQGETPIAWVQTQGDGTWSWSGPIPSGSRVTATLTDSGDTSEFSSPTQRSVAFAGKVCPPHATLIDCYPDITLTLWKKKDDRWKKASNAATDEEGAFELADDGGSDPGTEYLLEVDDPRFVVVAAEPGEGGEALPDGTIRYVDIIPVTYSGSIFRAEEAPTSILVVNTTIDGDDGRCEQPPIGDCTLRDAMASANAADGPREIVFDIPTEDPGYDSSADRWTIRPESTLPELTAGGGTIDASRHSGPVARYRFGDVCPLKPGIIVDGTGLPSGTSAYVFKSSHWTLKGLVLKGWPGPAIRLTSSAAHHVTLACNQIVDNIGDGILIESDAHHNTVGGTSGGNLIAGNGGDGVRVTGTRNGFNLVRRNYIGIDVDGLTAKPNTGNGVRLDGGAEYNDIGGELAAHRNVISGNGRSGVMIEGGDTMINRVGGNLIGLGADGDTSVGNGHHGVGLYDGTVVNQIGSSVLLPNHIAANGWSGVALVESNTNSVTDNTIGADPHVAPLRKDLGNASHGVHVVSGKDNSVSSNKIAANGSDGVRVQGVTAVNNIISVNAISGNGGKGIELLSGGNKELARPKVTDVTTTSISGKACSRCTVEVFTDPSNEALDVYSPPYAFADRLGYWAWTGTVGTGNVSATATDGAGNTSELSSGGWVFSGKVTVGSVQLPWPIPMPAEIRLYGSSASGEHGTLLAYAATAEDGSYEIDYGADGGAADYSVLALEVVDASVEVNRAESRSGGLVSAENTIEFHGVPRGLYVDNVFHLMKAQIADPGVKVVPWKIPRHPGPVGKVEPVDFVIEGIEVTQAVQCYSDLYSGNEKVCNKDNALPLAAGKATIVRVYATTTDFCIAPVAEGSVEVKLHVSWTGGSYTSSTTYNAVCAMAENRRKNTPGSANFYLDVPTDREVRLWAEVNADKSRTETDYTNNRYPVAGTEDVSFKTRLPLTVGYVLIDYHPKASKQFPNFSGSSKPSATWVGSKSARAEYDVYYPSGSVNYSYGGWMKHTGADARDDVKISGKVTCGYCELFAALQKYWKSWSMSTTCLKGVTCNVPSQVVGWLPKKATDHVFWGGVADAPPPVWTGTGRAILAVEGNSGVLAHEVGHNLKLFHAPCPQAGSPNAPKGIDPNWPNPNNALVGQIGFDVGNMWPTASGTQDFMSYCGPEWISPYHWKKLFDQLAPTTSPDEALAQGERYAVVSGALSDDGTGQLAPLMTLDATGQVPEPLPGGASCIVFYDGSGSGLGSYCFESSFTHPETYEYTGIQPFAHAVPLPPGAVRVALRHDGRTLATRTASASAPTVTIESPAGAEDWDGVRTVQWTATDSDGDALTYSVFYSSDGGSNWRPVAMDLTMPSFELDTTPLAGSVSARLRVIANDGFHSTAVDSAAFTVTTKAPKVFLDRPAANEVMAPDTAVYLSGSAYDTEDGQLPGSSVSWWSDHDGLLGRGGVLILPGGTLSVGNHTITLRGVDNDGQIGSAHTDVFVGHRLLLPTIARGE